ncbi:DoxX family protein [Chondromyces crocatus]|uniref:DoxX family protein n=1 Tax=Chondromyces crocatus TaxID=52 RepID=A0A0K1EQK2_CHOCO|nr:DoxX family protein [Chondromyces crocatus]AKT43084.1 uncharacterized protein CMC5_073120 [Chondromyces crocatus]
MHRVRFERHEGSGFPLRVVFPDGSWLGVNRDHQGLHSGDAHGRITQILEAGRFKAANPRQFARAYRRVFGQSIRAHATTATVPRESSVPLDYVDRGSAGGHGATPAPPRLPANAVEKTLPSASRHADPRVREPSPSRHSDPHVREPSPSRHSESGASGTRGLRPSEPLLQDPFAERPLASPPRTGGIRALFYPDPARTGSLGLLIVRVAAGLVLMPHGIYKALDAAQSLARGLAAKGLPAPLTLAWCATLAELVGGALVALGLLTRPAAVTACITMVVAWSTSHLGDARFIGLGKGAAFEYPLLLSLLFLAIAISGPGRYSLDAMLFDLRPHRNRR